MRQKVVKEKNALAERLKSAEAARKRFDEQLKRYANENMTREEIRQSLEDEVRRLTQTVGQTEGEKREKEEQIARCEAYIDGMEAKLQACQVFSYFDMIVISLLDFCCLPNLTNKNVIALESIYYVWVMLGLHHTWQKSLQNLFNSEDLLYK